jgi:hypothetical protein
MVSSGVLHRVALVRTDVSQERSASFIRVTTIGELGATLTATINQSVVTRATRRTIPEGSILHSHRRENLKSYIRAGTVRNSLYHYHHHRLPNQTVLVNMTSVSSYNDIHRTTFSSHTAAFYCNCCRQVKRRSNSV